MFALLKNKGFSAFIIVAFLNAFVDLGHKITIQNTIFKVYDGQTQIILTAIVNALILLPFILLFTPSGFLSDKYPKQKIMRISAASACVMTLIITISYYLGWFWLAFGMTFILAMQSAFYGPAKLGYIRELLGKEQIAQGNALLQAFVIVSILLSTFVFSVLFEKLLAGAEWQDKASLLQQVAPLGWLLVVLALMELWLAYQMPETAPSNNDMRFDWGEFIKGKSSRENVTFVWNDALLWQTIVGVSMFWAVSQVGLATYPAFAKESLGISSTAILQGIMACAGIGIMIGSLLAGRISQNHIETGLVPIGALGVALCLSGIAWFDSLWLQAANFIIFGIMGGLFIIPLNALMQYHAPKDHLGRVLATHNLINNLMMMSFLGLTILLASIGIGSALFFILLALVMLGTTIYTVYKLPYSLLRFVISRLFRARYRLTVLGFENLPNQGGALLLGNHISWIDWALVQMAAPKQVHFVMEHGYYEHWYLKMGLKVFNIEPIPNDDPKKMYATINELLAQGEWVCLFPEGNLSRTGQLANFHPVHEKLELADTPIIPFYLHGLWGSRFSAASGFLRNNRPSGFKRDIIVAFGEPLPAEVPVHHLKQRIFDLSFDAWSRYADRLAPLPVAWLYSAKRRGFQMAATDVLGEPLGNYRFITGVFCFSRLIKAQNPEQNVGFLLPTSAGSSLANIAALSIGKTVVNLNYTASAEALKGAAKQAELARIYTSRLFLKRLLERGIDIKAVYPDLSLIYLEDLRKEITGFQRVSTLLLSILLPTRLLQTLFIKEAPLEQTAAILFSSGSEGTPKGVELSHRNLASNVRQVADVLNTVDNDTLMGTLPAFHAFGLLAGILLPLSEGIPVVYHPDPTDAKNIAQGIAKYQATVLFGTATFLRLYARNKQVHPLMMQSLRYVVSGAERLPPEIRELFHKRFNKNIMEGYGTTETSPVAGVNLPDYIQPGTWTVQTSNRIGTIGLPLPGTCFRIVDPDTFEHLPTGEDGMILIGGPQVMKGYLKQPEKTAEVIIELDGRRWYQTGDKGHIDHEGFLTIVDRYSRFAKLGGEMVSLSALEQKIREVLKDPELDMVAVNLPDAKKGEKIILLLPDDHEPKSVKSRLLASDMNPLMIPASIYALEELPKLGSGKTDFATARKVALGMVG